MKKLLLLLLCLPIIGFGQDLSYNELINITDIKTFEKIMYEKGMRYIKGENYYTYFKATRKPEGGIILNDFKYGTTEFEPTSELFERTKQNYSYFGRNYNSKSETAEVFYKMKEGSKFKNYSSLTDKTLDNSGFQFNYIKFELQFADKSEYDKFWDTINIRLDYSHTNKDGERIYNYRNIEFEVKEYDEVMTIHITNNL